MILFMAKKILMSFAMSTRDKKKEEEVVLQILKPPPDECDLDLTT